MQNEPELPPIPAAGFLRAVSVVAETGGGWRPDPEDDEQPDDAPWGILERITLKSSPLGLR